MEGGWGGGDCEIRKSRFISRFLAFSPCPVTTVYLRSLSFESFVNFPFLILPWINGERYARLRTFTSFFLYADEDGRKYANPSFSFVWPFFAGGIE